MPARLKHMHDRVGSAYDDPHNGWKPFCRSLRVIPVHADHLSIVFEPHVSAVSACLRDLLIAEPVRKSAATSAARR
jgi:thioesterase domain-containing protein